MRNLGLVVLGTALAGCAGVAPPAQQTAAAPRPVPVTPMKLEKADIALIEVGTRSSLKDPDSARFGRMIAGRDSGGSIVVCLMVNGKNSYGGYSGEKPFMGMLFRDKKLFVVLPDDGKFPEYRDQSVYTVCADNGLSLTGT
jgi:hypothetical protein